MYMDVVIDRLTGIGFSLPKLIHKNVNSLCTTGRYNWSKHRQTELDFVTCNFNLPCLQVCVEKVTPKLFQFFSFVSTTGFDLTTICKSECEVDPLCRPRQQGSKNIFYHKSALWSRCKWSGNKQKSKDPRFIPSHPGNLQKVFKIFLKFDLESELRFSESFSRIAGAIEIVACTEVEIRPSKEKKKGGVFLVLCLHL
jgi:hypothetical protein